MSKVLIDSSIWVSYFLGIKKNTPIYQKVSKIIAEAETILIRLGHEGDVLSEVKLFFEGEKCLKYQHDHHFWFKRLEFYMNQVRLRTQDLVVLAATFEKWPCELITGDKALLQAYIFLKNRYAETKY